MFYPNNSVFHKQVAYIKQKTLLVKHIIDSSTPPAVPITIVVPTGPIR